MNTIEVQAAPSASAVAGPEQIVDGDGHMLAVEQLTAANDRHGAERSDPTSSQNSLRATGRTAT